MRKQQLWLTEVRFKSVLRYGLIIWGSSTDINGALLFRRDALELYVVTGPMTNIGLYLKD